MLSKASASLVLALSATALVSQVAATPRAATAFLSASQNWVINNVPVNGTSDRAVLAGDGCPAGWDPCSATTCYPLDGSQCCSDGNFCTPGTVCQDGGCCPRGKICGGSAPPPITVGGDEPTDTDTFELPTQTDTFDFSTTSSTRSTTRTTPTTTHITFEPTTDPTEQTTDFNTLTSPARTGTSSISSLTDALGPDPTDDPDSDSDSDRPQFPFGNNGATPVARNVWIATVLSGVLAGAMYIA